MSAQALDGASLQAVITAVFAPLLPAQWTGAALLQTLLWSALTIAAYFLALWLFKRARQHPLCIPVLTAGLLMGAILLGSGTSYGQYETAAAQLKWMLAPALVLLAVPLRQQLVQMRTVWRPLLGAVMAGSVTAMVCVLAIGWVFALEPEVLISMLPKSATMPIAVQGAQALGGLPGLTAVNVAFTGIAGAMMIGPMLRWMRLKDEILRGVTMGLTAHAIGVAHEMPRNQTSGTFAALAMSLTGVCTAVLLPLGAAF